MFKERFVGLRYRGGLGGFTEEGVDFQLCAQIKRQFCLWKDTVLSSLVFIQCLQAKCRA